jgi:hypothetical protein
MGQDRITYGQPAKSPPEGTWVTQEIGKRFSQLDKNLSTLSSAKSQPAMVG